jgi:hypothetical protein
MYINVTKIKKKILFFLVKIKITLSDDELWQFIFLNKIM